MIPDLPEIQQLSFAARFSTDLKTVPLSRETRALWANEFEARLVIVSIMEAGYTRSVD